MRHFQAKVAEKIKTHNLCSITIFFENRACYEIVWTNMVEPDRPGDIRRRVRFVCWITEDTNTQLEYCFSTVTMVTRTRLILRNT